jgi:NADPH:quinone reductase
MTGLPDTMTAIEIAGKGGGPEVLVPREFPTPRPGGRQVLIKVAAAGVNGPDVQQRKGQYPAPKGHSEIPGLEVAGTIAATGPSTTRFKPGDTVMALVNGGGYAEYCLAPETSCLPVPSRLSLIIEAAGVPETFFTVWDNVFERGGLKARE